MRITTLALLGLGLGFSLVACRGDSGGGGGDDAAVDPDAPPRLTIKDVQNDSMAVGTAVSLKGVIVTAVDTFGARTGDLFVEDAEGGPFSGIKVFNAPLDVVSTLQPGDIVDISNALKDEFALASDTSGRKTTELKPPSGGQMTVMKTGTGTVPSPAVVDAVAIAKMAPAAQDAEWEKWEGVLITVSNVAQLTPVTSFGSAMPTPDDSFKFEVDGKLVVESVMFKFPATSAFGFCYSSITGIGDYFFDHLLLPRSAAELGSAGTGCQATTVGTATISQIQSGAVTGMVQVKDVFVTGLTFNKKSFWISSNLAAAPNESVFVYRPSSATVLDAAVVPGAKVNVTGSVSEFNDDTLGGTLTELNGLDVTVQAGAPGTLVPVTGQTAATLLQSTTAPMYESVLVTLTDVNLTTLGGTTNGFIATAVQNGTSFGAGTDVLHFVAGDLKCYSSITGFWTNLQAASTAATTKPNAFGFIPVTLGAPGTACN
ncbi:MAG TPA: hypothetical protein VN253_23965 [Kofleriaceae bacterium]|nr:hypothetical protein [Kofleriaceae bacterium]